MVVSKYVDEVLFEMDIDDDNDDNNVNVKEIENYLNRIDIDY
jgi:hypothetical protein